MNVHHLTAPLVKKVSIPSCRVNTGDPVTTQLVLPPSTAVQVEDWAGSCCRQALLLADGVVWTRAATSALQQLEAGNSHALRALADSAVLQLETIATVLRQSRLHQDEQGAGWPGGASTSPQVLVVHGSEVPEAQQQPQPQQVQQHQACQQQSIRPATPDPTEALLMSKASRHSLLRCSHQENGAAATSPSSTSTHPAVHVAHASTSSCGSSSSSSTDACKSGDCRNPRSLLTTQQVLGLQLLVAAGTCHREVSAALVSAGAHGPAAFEWGQQLRLYWQPEEGQLQVCVAVVCPKAAALLQSVGVNMMALCLL